MNIKDILNKVEQNGGITLNAALEEVKADSGFAVSLPGNETQVNGQPSEESAEALLEVYQHLAKGAYIGIWKSETGAYYFDITQVTEDRETAIRLGKHYNQLAIFDFNTKEVINLAE